MPLGATEVRILPCAPDLWDGDQSGRSGVVAPGELCSPRRIARAEQEGEAGEAVAEPSKGSLAVSGKFGIAMVAYVALAVMAWVTLPGVMPVHVAFGSVIVIDRQVPLVWIVWLLLGLFAFRSVMFLLRVRLEQSVTAQKNSPM